MGAPAAVTLKKELTILSRLSDVSDALLGEYQFQIVFVFVFQVFFLSNNT